MLLRKIPMRPLMPQWYLLRALVRVPLSWRLAPAGGHWRCTPFQRMLAGDASLLVAHCRSLAKYCTTWARIWWEKCLEIAELSWACSPQMIAPSKATVDCSAVVCLVSALTLSTLVEDMHAVSEAVLESAAHVGTGSSVLDICAGWGTLA
jgi:hypothetical protein